MKYDKAKLVAKLQAKRTLLMIAIEKDKQRITEELARREAAFDAHIAAHLHEVKAYWKAVRKLTGKNFYAQLVSIPKAPRIDVPLIANNRHDYARDIATLDIFIKRLNLVAGATVNLGNDYDFQYLLALID